MNLTDFLSGLLDKGIRLWSEGDQLRYRAPTGAMTQDIHAVLVERKTELLRFLRLNNQTINAAAPTIVPVVRNDRMPLSFAQERLWFLDQLEPGSVTYNITVAIRIKEALRVEVLDLAVNEIIRRHEALRTRFEVRNGMPVQVIDADQVIKLETVNLEGMDGKEQARRIEELANEEGGRSFDLARGPLLRMKLARLAEGEHGLFFTMHHIVSDGWSMGVLAREFIQLYEAFSQGQPSPLGELPIQYADYAVWQRGWLQGEVLEKQLGYWKEQLKGWTGVIDLPTDKPRPPVQTHGAVRHRFSFSEGLTRELNELSRKNGATLFMTLLAGFKALLFRYTGERDIAVGTPIANRTRAETEGLIGFFLNILVLRTSFHGDPAFEELLKREREILLGAYAHQEIPFEKLLQELQPSRDISRTSLFQVFFNMLNLENEKLKNSSLTFEPLVTELSAAKAKFDLTLYASEWNGKLQFDLLCSTDLFVPETAQEIAENFASLLEECVKLPATPISSIILPKCKNWAKVNFGPSREFCEYQRHAIEKSVGSRFEEQVHKFGSALAVKINSHEWSYVDLNRMANKVANRLLSVSKADKTRVALVFEHGAPLIASIMGVLKTGGVYVPLDGSYPKHRLEILLKDCAADILLVGDKTTASSGKLDFTGLIIHFDALESFSEMNPRLEVAAECPAYILYTSGSTGAPKGVIQNHRNLQHFISVYTNNLKISCRDCISLVAPYTCDAAVMDIFGALLNGACVCPMDLRKNGFSGLDEWVREQNITIFHSTPTVFRQFLQTAPKKELLQSIRLVVLGGEQVIKRDVDLFTTYFGANCTLINGYGPTESTVTAQAFIQSSDDTCHGTVPIGCPVSDTEVVFFNETGQEVPLRGEMGIKSEYVALGYWRQDELSRCKFLKAEGNRRVYLTGDLGRRRIDGRLEFLGRKDNQVKIRGFRVELGEIEHVMRSHPKVQESLAIVRETEASGNEIVAYFVPPEGVDFEPDELTNYLRLHLPDYMVPSVVVPLKRLPLIPNGKVDLKALPAPVRPRPVAKFVQPTNPLETMLESVWKTALHLERIGIYDNFFALGGHSLLLFKIIAELKSRFGIDLPIRVAFANPTIADMARVIAQGDQMARSERNISPSKKKTQIPLSASQRFILFFEQLVPERALYHIPLVVELRGELNVNALSQSFNELISRHEILRMGFDEMNGIPLQTVRTVEFTMKVVDLEKSFSGQGPEDIHAIVDKEIQTKFDLERGPLIKANLFRLKAEVHVLAIVLHHIAVDEWSINLLMAEFSAMYDKFAQGIPHALPDVSLQYGDFCLWQQKHLDSEEFKTQLESCKSRFQDAPEGISLFLDRPRPSVRTYRGSRISKSIPPKICNALSKFAKTAEITPASVLLTSLNALLFRYSEQKDILIGMPVSGRHMPQYENLVGLFVNTLVVRTTVDAQISFRELAARVWKNWIEAHTYQDVPFELLVRELAPKRDLSFSPIFQVMFSYYHQHDEILSKFDAELRLAQLSVKPFGDYSTQTSKFDFSFSAAENEDGYSIWLDFDTDLYSADRAEAILDHFMVLLHSAVTHPDLQVAKMPLVTKSERTMLMSWNNTDQRFSKLIICHSFQQQAIQRPNDVAVSYDSGTMTYREVSDSANYLAGQLISIGVKNGMFVPFLMEGGCLVPVAMLGTMKAGAAFVPLDLRWPQELLQHSMDQLNPKVLLCDSSCHHLANQLSGGIRVIEVKPVRDAVKIVESEISMTDPIYAIFTSGSTGDPKAVAVPHRGISNRFNWMNDYFGTEAAKSVLQTTRHVFDSAVWQLLWPLTNGGKTTILNGSAALNAETIADLIALNQVTITDFVPSVFNMIAPSVMHNPVLRDKLKTLRVLIVGGEEITTTTTLDFQKMFPELVIVNLYGPTEASIGSICYRVEGNETKIPIGKPIMNTKALIVNECGQLCPVGIAGEIVLLGECLGLGYLNDPASTQAAFVKNPFSEVKCARMYRTGDIGYFSADGNIHFIGRHDYQIKVRGHRIELGQIEAAILKYPEVKQTCVIVRHDNGRPMIVAYIAPICSSMTNDNMRRFLRTQVPDYMIPAAFVFLNIIPIGSNGKINRRALPIPDLQQLLFAGPARNPLSQAEKCIAAAWEDVLKLKIADVNANFFDVGGHSLLLPQLSAALSSRLNRTVSILDIFRYPTIADLANHLENTSITEVPKPVGFAINRTKDGVQTRMRRIRTKSVS